MKTLANCDNIEFMQQTYKIIDAIKEYLTETKIMEIRKRVPDTEGMSEEEKAEVLKKAGYENLMEMIKTALDTNAEKTLHVLGLVCFCKDDKEIKTNRRMLQEAIDALADESVLGFFISAIHSVSKISKIM